MAVIFLSHPFSHAPKEAQARIQTLTRNLALEGHVPIAPQIYLPQFINEKTERDLALKLCLKLVALADEVRVYGSLSAGVRLEIAEAHRMGIPVVAGRIE